MNQYAASNDHSEFLEVQVALQNLQIVLILFQNTALRVFFFYRRCF